MQNKTTIQRLRERASTESGFTLIELLIVIVILGILAAIVVFAVGTTGSNAKATACKADEKTVETALEAYKAVNGSYPAYADQTSYSALTASPAQYLKEAPPTTEGISWTGAGVVSGTATGC